MISAQPDFLDVTPAGADTANLKHKPQKHPKPRLQIKHLLRVVWIAVGITGILAALALPITPWATLAVAAATTILVVWAAAQSEAKNYSSRPDMERQVATKRLSIAANEPEIVDKLFARDLTVIFRPHPASRSSPEHELLIHQIHAKLAQDTFASGRQHLWGEQAQRARSVADVTNTADAMIADVSGVVTDFMQSGKTYAMASIRRSAEEFWRKFPTARSAYVIDPTPGSIDAALDQMLGDDPLADYRWERRSYYLGGFEGRESLDRFIEESQKLISGS